MQTDDKMNQSQGFTMGDPDVVEQGESLPGQSDGQGIKKIARRLTLLAVILVMFILSVSLYSYIELTAKISAIQDSGSVEVETASKDLETKLTSLTVEYAKLKYLVDEHVKSYDMNTSKIEGQLSASVKRFEKIEFGKTTFEKATAKDIAKLSKRVNKKFNDLSGSLSGIKKSLGRSDSKLMALEGTVDLSGKELKTIIKAQSSKSETHMERLSKSMVTMEKEIGSLKKSSADILDTKLNKKEFADRATNLEKDLLVQLNLTRGIIDKRITALEAKLKSRPPASVLPKAPAEIQKTPPVKMPKVPPKGIIEKNIE